MPHIYAQTHYDAFFVQGFQLFFVPILELYGGWATVGYLFGLFVINTIGVVMFLVGYGRLGTKPSRPQATPKQETTS